MTKRKERVDKSSIDKTQKILQGLQKNLGDLRGVLVQSKKAGDEPPKAPVEQFLERMEGIKDVLMQSRQEEVHQEEVPINQSFLDSSALGNEGSVVDSVELELDPHAIEAREEVAEALSSNNENFVVQTIREDQENGVNSSRSESLEEITSKAPMVITHEVRIEPVSDIIPSDGVSPEMRISDDSDWMTLLGEAEEIAIPEEGVVEKEEGLEDRLDEDFRDLAQEESKELMEAIEANFLLFHKKDMGVVAAFCRDVHTLKGTMGMAGAMKTRQVLHKMEEILEEIKDGRRKIDEGMVHRIEDMLVKVRENLKAMFQVHVKVTERTEEGAESVVQINVPKTMKVSTEIVDRLFSQINEARLTRIALEGGQQEAKIKLKEMEESLSRFSRMLRDLELQAETQIQSGRLNLPMQEGEFDPLEMDRFTKLQELSRMLTETLSDVQDIQRDLAKTNTEQETYLAYQERSIAEVQGGLHKTRLTPVDAIHDRLHKVVAITGKELDKPVRFELVGGRVELDKTLLEKIVPPLEHILRNSLAHGIEPQEKRKVAGKSVKGLIRLSFSQEAGKAIIVIEDDGAGLNLTKIKEKAVEKGLWDKYQDMNETQAAEMICRQGFSTADSVSEVAGRGVGMDVVRSDILALGGRFEIVSYSGKGLKVTIQVPTAVASASVMVVEAGDQQWSVPVDVVEDVFLASKNVLKEALSLGRMTYQEQEYLCTPLVRLLGLSEKNWEYVKSSPILVLKEGSRRMLVMVDKLCQVNEAPLRSLGSLWSHRKGILGATILPDGQASFFIDPMRSPWEEGRALFEEEVEDRKPLVMVVDDSITVRKATSKFLERFGYDFVLAKDGQEALELMAVNPPDVVLLDVEMPKMDGFDCAKNIRETPRYAQIPIIMITSRTADKHRQRALQIGVNEYLGKPFREDELLGYLKLYVPGYQPSSNEIN